VLIVKWSKPEADEDTHAKVDASDAAQRRLARNPAKRPEGKRDSRH
jgi:hypothetical protein